MWNIPKVNNKNTNDVSDVVLMFLVATLNIFRINYVEEISIKSGAKKMKDYQQTAVLLFSILEMLFLKSYSPT